MTDLWVGARVKLCKTFKGVNVVPAGATGTVISKLPHLIRAVMDEDEYNFMHGGLDAPADAGDYFAAPEVEWERVPFKLGDRVKVRDNSYGAPGWTEGTFGTISEVTFQGEWPEGSLGLNLGDGLLWWFAPQDLAFVPQESPVKAPESDANATESISEGTPTNNDIALGSVREERVVDPDSGGAKGRKDAEYALIPTSPLEQLAKVYGMGAKKYEPWNWTKGYDWNLSYSALFRHIEAHRSGVSTDDESGLSHLAHAAFHLFALMEFERLGLGKDTRWKG